MHLFGDSRGAGQTCSMPDVGPNLTGSQRVSPDFLMTNVVEPSAILAKDYLMTTVHTKDGQQQHHSQGVQMDVQGKATDGPQEG